MKKFRKFLALTLASTLVFGSIGIQANALSSNQGLEYSDASSTKLIGSIDSVASHAVSTRKNLSVNQDGSKAIFATGTTGTDANKVFLVNGNALSAISQDKGAVEDAIISRDGSYAVWKRKNLSSQFELVGYDIASGTEEVITTSTAKIMGTVSISKGGTNVGFAANMSGTNKFGIYNTKTKELKSYTLADLGTDNTSMKLYATSTPIIVTEDGNLAYYTYYYSTYSNAVYISVYDFSQNKKLRDMQNSADGMHPYAISEDEQTMFGYKFSNGSKQHMLSAPVTNTSAQTVLFAGSIKTWFDIAQDGKVLLVNDMLYDPSSGTGVTSLTNATSAGFSGDSKIVVHFDSGKLYRTNIEEFKANLPSIGYAPKLADVKAAPTKSGVEISISPSLLATENYSVYRDGVFLKTISPRYDATVDMSAVPGETHNYKIYTMLDGQVSYAYAEAGATALIGKQVSLGNKTVRVGDFVRFDGMQWKVMDNNYIMANNTSATTTFESDGTTQSKWFNPSVTTNVGYYLNNTWYNKLSATDRSAIQEHQWEITLKDAPYTTVKTVTANVGLPTMKDILTLDYPHIIYSSFWTMSAESASDTRNAVFYDASTNTVTTPFANLSKAVRAAVHIKSSAVVSGTGTSSDPYNFDVAEVPLNKPENVIAVPESDTNIKISWSASEGAEKYQVKKGTEVIYEGPALAFDATGLKANTLYTFSVSAMQGERVSEEVVVSATTKPEAALPKPVGLNIVKVNDGVAKLSWQAVVGAQKYKVYTDGANPVEVLTTELMVEGAIGSTHTYAVEAVGTNGASGAQATVEYTYPRPDIDAPKDLKVVSATKDGVTISWSAGKVGDTYQVERDSAVIADSTDKTYIIDNNVVAGSRYVYSVSTIRGGFTSAPATIVVDVPVEVAKLPAPTNFKVGDVTHNSAKVTWDAVAGADEYILKRNGMTVIVTMSTWMNDKGLQESNTYTYKVAAIKDGVEGEYASLVVETPKEPEEQLPAAPQNFKVEKDTNTTATLSWNFVDGAAKYYVYVDGLMFREVGGNTNTLTVSGNPGQTYGYSVAAVSASGLVGGEATKGYTFPAVTVKLKAPKTLTVQDATYQQVAVSWDSVDDADGYELYRDGQVIMPFEDQTFFEDTTVVGGSRYVYSVKAVKDGAYSPATFRVVNTPVAPVEGKGPTETPVVTILKTYHDKVNIQINPVPNATKYQIIRNGLLVYEGSLNVISDTTVSENSNYSYVIKALNEWGETVSAPVEVTTPAEAQEIVVEPAEPKSGQVTMSFREVNEAEWYEADRNPNWKITPLGDGTYNVYYSNEVTGDTKDYGNFPIVNGSITFFEENVDPSRDYHYEITAIKRNANGDPEVIGKAEVEVTTPDDNSGATVPGGTTPPVIPPTDPSNPGNGGTTDPSNPGNGGNTGGETTDPSNPGNGGSIGGGTTDPSNPGNGGSTGGGTTDPSNPGNGGSIGGGTTDPSNPGNGGSIGGGTTDPSNPGNGGSTGGETIDPSKPGTTTPGAGENNESNGSGEGSGTGEENKTETPEDIKGHFAEKEINALIEKDIIKGYADGTFAPNKQVTRAEFAIMLKRAMGYEGSKEINKDFKDLSATAWYAEELSEAIEMLVTKGYNDGTYRPNNQITREQAAIMVSNILMKELVNPTMTKAEFKDYANITAWATDGVNIASTYEIIKGYSDGKFYPKKNITRAETAIMIYRLLEVIK